MKHARPDYDRIQDPEHLIPEDEPVFLIRGQDEAAVLALQSYARIHDLLGGDPEVSRLVREHAERMRAWPKKKLADVPNFPGLQGPPFLDKDKVPEAKQPDSYGLIRGAVDFPDLSPWFEYNDHDPMDEELAVWLLGFELEGPGRLDDLHLGGGENLIGKDIPQILWRAPNKVHVRGDLHPESVLHLRCEAMGGTPVNVRVTDWDDKGPCTTDIKYEADLTSKEEEEAWEPSLHDYYAEIAPFCTYENPRLMSLKISPGIITRWEIPEISAAFPDLSETKLQSSWPSDRPLLLWVSSPDGSTVTCELSVEHGPEENRQILEKSLPLDLSPLLDDDFEAPEDWIEHAVWMDSPYPKPVRIMSFELRQGRLIGAHLDGMDQNRSPWDSVEGHIWSSRLFLHLLLPPGTPYTPDLVTVRTRDIHVESPSPGFTVQRVEDEGKNET